MHIQGSWGLALTGKPPHSPESLKVLKVLKEKKLLINYFRNYKRNCSSKSIKAASNKSKRGVPVKSTANAQTPTRTMRSREMATELTNLPFLRTFLNF